MSEPQVATMSRTPDASETPKAPARKASLWHIPMLGLALLLAGAGAFWWWMRPAPTIQYLTQKVTRGPIVRAVTATGAVNPFIVVQVGTYVSGVVQARFCDYNTEVKKGQICAKIDPGCTSQLLNKTAPIWRPRKPNW